MPSHSRPWSPDGRRIAFYRHTTRARSAVYVMNVDRSGEQPLTPGPLRRESCLD